LSDCELWFVGASFVKRKTF